MRSQLFIAEKGQDADHVLTVRRRVITSPVCIDGVYTFVPGISYRGHRYYRTVKLSMYPIERVAVYLVP